MSTLGDATVREEGEGRVAAGGAGGGYSPGEAEVPQAEPGHPHRIER